MRYGLNYCDERNWISISFPNLEINLHLDLLQHSVFELYFFTKRTGCGIFAFVCSSSPTWKTAPPFPLVYLTHSLEPGQHLSFLEGFLIPVSSLFCSELLPCLATNWHWIIFCLVLSSIGFMSQILLETPPQISEPRNSLAQQ